MGRVKFSGRDEVRTTFSDKNVVQCWSISYLVKSQ